MIYKTIKYSIAGLAVLLCACLSPKGEKASGDHLIGTWQLDEKTHLAITHHCVETEFTGNPATFTLKRKGDALWLQFIGQDHIWIAPANRKSFNACQMLKSSASGRFCGFQTEICIYFRLTGPDQSQIKGLWRTPTCDYCPQVDFVAHKID
jgi:hypothetical protein